MKIEQLTTFDAVIVPIARMQSTGTEQSDWLIGNRKVD
jgi:hypothetical protein